MSRKGVSSKAMPKRGAGSRELMKAAQSQGGGAIVDAAMGLATRKYGPKYFRLILKIAAKNPVEAQIASGAGMSITSLRYMLKLSRAGRPGDIFDVKMADGRVERLHILFEDAVETGWGEVEHKAFKAATGQEKELLTDRGRVQYKYDRDLLALGMTGEAAYLLDEFGDPVPETIPLLDLEMIRWLLSRRMPEKYGNKQQIDVNHKHNHGVLVVGIPKTSKELEETYGSMRHDTIEDVPFTVVEGDTAVVKIEDEESAS